MLTQLTSLGLLVTLTAGPSRYIPRFVTPNEKRGSQHSVDLTHPEHRTPGNGLKQDYLNDCRDKALCSRYNAEYGAVLKANPRKVLVPSQLLFHNEGEVQAFQRRAGVASLRLGNVIVELQPRALRAFKAARQEARSMGLKIEPRGADASRRSYGDTVHLWQTRVNAGLSHWITEGKLSAGKARKLRALSAEQQVSEVLALERKGLYFGNQFRRSILRSVAAPGTSQHLLMLAVDIKQHDNAQVRSILAKYGWFQTIKGDAPHFTYLGVNESRLSALGLKRDQSGGRTVWVTKTSRATKSKATDNLLSVGSESALPPKPNSEVHKVPKTLANKTFPPINSSAAPSAKASRLLGRLVARYFKKAGHFLYITSAYRTPRQQAQAMYKNLRAYGVNYVLGVYRWRPAAREIVAAYRHHRSSRKAIDAMTIVIQKQVKRNLYVSRHMRGQAFDVRLSSARPQILREVVQDMGGTVGLERGHYHIQF